MHIRNGRQMFICIQRSACYYTTRQINFCSNFIANRIGLPHNICSCLDLVDDGSWTDGPVFVWYSHSQRASGKQHDVHVEQLYSSAWIYFMDWFCDMHPRRQRDMVTALSLNYGRMNLHLIVRRFVAFETMNGFRYTFISVIIHFFFIIHIQYIQ